MYDNLFYLAVMALGFGASLSTYRLFAMRNGWPMGAFHADIPAVPIMLGLVSVVVATLFAAARVDVGGWIIMGAGLMLAFLWTGLLRVGSQLSLFLAPIVTGLLLLGWLGSLFGYDRAAAIIENPRDYLPKVRIERRTPDEN
ncbi:MAG: hypothetical protein SH859_12115 [Hyphomicrobium aestuarii]|nr:hypothetical protein [Hyphomicrobium aestuarii]